MFPLEVQHPHELTHPGEDYRRGVAVQFRHPHLVVCIAGTLQSLQEKLGGSVLQQPIPAEAGVRRHQVERLLRTDFHSHNPGGTCAGNAVHIHADFADVPRGSAIRLSEKSNPDLLLTFDHLFDTTNKHFHHTNQSSE